jgi:hypothetical protein
MKQALYLTIVLMVVTAAGCRQDSPVAPVSDTSTSLANATEDHNPSVGGPPGYEDAYYNDTTVLINAIELSQHAPEQAQADFWEVVYPIGWESLNVGPPQCNPCDHEGNGIDFTDYHDHVLDSVPSSPGHGEYRALWHVYLILPAYNQDPTHDNAVSAAYAAHLPMRSEAELNAILGETMPDHSPVAVTIDTDFYFLCAVVNRHAGR